MAKLGESIRRARQRAGLTQEALGKSAGLSAAYISQVESGRRADPQFTSVVKICRALGISLDDLASPNANASIDQKARARVGPLKRLVADLQKTLDALKAEIRD